MERFLCVDQGGEETEHTNRRHPSGRNPKSWTRRRGNRVPLLQPKPTQPSSSSDRKLQSLGHESTPATPPKGRAPTPIGEDFPIPPAEDQEEPSLIAVAGSEDANHSSPDFLPARRSPWASSSARRRPQPSCCGRISGCWRSPSGILKGRGRACRTRRGSSSTRSRRWPSRDRWCVQNKCPFSVVWPDSALFFSVKCRFSNVHSWTVIWFQLGSKVI